MPLAAGTPLAPGYVVEGHLSRNQVLDVYEAVSYTHLTLPTNSRV